MCNIYFSFNCAASSVTHYDETGGKMQELQHLTEHKLLYHPDNLSTAISSEQLTFYRTFPRFVLVFPTALTT